MKMRYFWTLIILFYLAALLSKLPSSSGDDQCGSQTAAALCLNGVCRTIFGQCGSTDKYCLDGCRRPCSGAGSNPTPTPSGGVASIVTPSLFGQMLKHKDDSQCTGKGFYTYNAFINAARSFNGFGTTGDIDTRKRELAAFFGQTSHATTGGWPTAPDGPYTWGYCFKCELGSSDRYRGRGPIQLSYDFNYQQAGQAIGVDLLDNPDLVSTDATISFKTAIWFWMTPQGNKPSCHSVITRAWITSEADNAAGRVPGYGVITNIINGGLECGKGYNDKVADRIGFYKRYCDLLQVDYGDDLDCYNQRSFGN